MKLYGTLLGVFAYLSLATVGGGMAAYPELETLTVNEQGWLTSKDLVHFYSLGQTAPGPNMMMVAAVGAHVGGLLGALTAVSAFLLPTGALTWGVGRLWQRLKDWPWRASIQAGLAPVALGLVASGCWSLAKTAVTGPLTVTIAVIVFCVLSFTKINPVLTILAGAVVGWCAQFVR